MKFGIQLFGVLKDRRSDTMDALRSLAGLGFKRAEPCLSFSPIPGWEHVIWPAEWFESHAAEIRALDQPGRRKGGGVSKGPAPAPSVTAAQQESRDRALEENQRELKKLLASVGGASE